jgi:hypothetical protein
VFISQINPRYTITNDNWVVSVLNTGPIYAGHNVIVVEGLNAGQLFVGQYDIKATSDPIPGVADHGYITRVDCHEGPGYTRDYSGYRGHVSYAPAAGVTNMITSIKADKDIIDHGGLIKFQLLGLNHPLSDPEGGHNCASWSKEKLDIAGIRTRGTKPFWPFKASSSHNHP